MGGRINDGGPAYPTHPSLYSSEDWRAAQGMSLRDAAALAALQGLLSAGAGYKADTLVSMAWQTADAFIAARGTDQ